jgi:hypothetical protein
MKTLIKTTFLALTLLWTVTSCNEDNEAMDTNDSISTEEAAQQMGTTLSTDFMQVTSDLGFMSARSSDGSGRVEVCGTSFDTTFTKSRQGTYRSFNYEVSYGYEILCTNSIPDRLEIEMGTNGSRENQRFTSDGETNATYTVSGFGAAANYTLNGNLKRTAISTRKIGEQNSWNSTSDLNLSDILINKETGMVQSGTATYTYSGSGTGGNSFEFTASITFGGEGTAIISINGEEYQVDLNSGEVGNA